MVCILITNLYSHSDVSGWTIQLGITRRYAHSFYGQKMKVKRVVPHPMYNLEVTHDNDIALFQVSQILYLYKYRFILPFYKKKEEENLKT